MNHDSDAGRLSAPLDSDITYKDMALHHISSTMATLTTNGIPESSTMATMIGIIIVILVAIAVLFGLGLFIDCRHQKLIDEKIDSSGRKRSRYTGSFRNLFRKSNSANDATSNITENMEDNGRSRPAGENECGVV